MDWQVLDRSAYAINPHVEEPGLTKHESFTLALGFTLRNITYLNHDVQDRWFHLSLPYPNERANGKMTRYV